MRHKTKLPHLVSALILFASAAFAETYIDTKATVKCPFGKKGEDREDAAEPRTTPIVKSKKSLTEEPIKADESNRGTENGVRVK
ncbi:MAG: hypothetical protein PHP46_03855 [Candidatus Omnitrophica bacterium]|nr:hypothetical protein [Candidatus Omnitrophota bacterium]